MSPRVLVVANVASGRSRAARALPALVDALRARGLAAEVRETRAPGDAGRAVAAAAGARAVVVLGGDGTVREAAGAVADGPPLVILPTGTANLLARDLGLRPDPRAAAAAAAAGAVVHVDLALARNGAGEERRFLCTAGAGIDGAVVHAVHAARRGPLGFRGYAGPVLAAARSYPFPPVRASVDGADLGVGTTAVACNTRAWGGPLTLAPAARVDDGRLDACLLAVRGGSLLPHLFAAWRGTLARRPGVRLAAGTRFLAESEVTVPVQVDGDPFGSTPLEAHLDGARARFLVPAEDPA